MQDRQDTIRHLSLCGIADGAVAIDARTLWNKPAASIRFRPASQHGPGTDDDGRRCSAHPISSLTAAM